jgi:hypothetical protein
MTEQPEITYEVINDSDVETVKDDVQPSAPPPTPLEPTEEEPKQRKGGRVKKDMRTRKEYMRDYYHKTRKVDAVCSGCNCTFVCKSSMRHHEETNWLCLLSRMTSNWQKLMTHEAPQTFLPEIRGEIEKEISRANKLIARSKRENKGEKQEVAETT